MEIRGWCCSGSDSIQLGSVLVGNHHQPQHLNDDSTTSTTATTGCCCWSTISTRRAKWRRLMRQKVKSIFESSSQVMAVPATTSTAGLQTACSYDRWSYEQNFDKGSMMWDDEEERDNITRSFSMRFAQCPSSKDLTFVVHHRQQGTEQRGGGDGFLKFV